MAFLEECGDWLIDARRRWREGDPPTSGSARPLLLRLLSVLVVLALVLQHLLGA
ncbi:MAG: hypothetical protein ACRDJ3_09605 [Solirubrobacteraceae bacterium]